MQKENPYNKAFGALYYKAKESGDFKHMKPTWDFLLDFDYKGAKLNANLGNSEAEIEKNFSRIFNTNTIAFANGVDGDGNEVSYENIPIDEAENFSYEIG